MHKYIITALINISFLTFSADTPPVQFTPPAPAIPLSKTQQFIINHPISTIGLITGFSLTPFILFKDHKKAFIGSLVFAKAMCELLELK